jgi:hypothetical protein
MTRRLLTFRLAVVCLVIGGSLTAYVAAAGPPGSTGLLPDVQTVVPKHLGIQNTHQREILRFTNGIANTGPGHLRMRPDPIPRTSDELTTTAIQEILDSSGKLVSERVAGTFEYHPEHNHWHIGNVALFEVRHAVDDGRGGDYGSVFVNDRGQAQSIKTTFCLIDSYRLNSNSPTSQREYWACETSYQGIQPNWVDQYHQALEGQSVDVTGMYPGLYYLVSTSNPDRVFLESDYSNNTAWTSFRLSRDSNGNPKIAIIANSPCDSPGMCGAQSTNR